MKPENCSNISRESLARFFGRLLKKILVNHGWEIVFMNHKFCSCQIPVKVHRFLNKIADEICEKFSTVFSFCKNWLVFSIFSPEIVFWNFTGKRWFFYKQFHWNFHQKMHYCISFTRSWFQTFRRHYYFRRFLHQLLQKFHQEDCSRNVFRDSSRIFFKWLL